MEKNRERGEVMIEATYCMTIAIFVIFFLLSLSFLIYQKSMVVVVANQVAEELSQTYKLRDVTDNSNVTSNDIKGIGKYRYWLFKGNYQSRNEEKAKKFTELRLSQTSFGKKEGALTVDIETVVDDIGRRHYVVTVKQQYAILLQGFLQVIGIDKSLEFTAVSYVESVDVSNYINTVKFTKYGINKVAQKIAPLTVIDKVIKLLHSIFSIFD